MTAIAAVLERALLPVGLIIVVGYLLRRLRPGGLDPMATRHAINQLVMFVFYPALVLDIVTDVELTTDLIWVPVLTTAGVLSGMAFGWVCFSRSIWGQLNRPQIGALMLACGFSNTISIGLPVLEAVFGTAARRYGVYADVLAIAPLLWIAGIWAGLRFGGRSGAAGAGVIGTLVRLPPIWAFVAALGLNFAQVEIPSGLARALATLGWATIPCMLLTVGMSLSAGYISQVRGVVAAVGFLKLVAVPAVVYGVGMLLIGSGELVGATALTAAMPTMMATVVISEQFGLDTEMLAAAMVTTTLVCFVTLGCWIIVV